MSTLVECVPNFSEGRDKAKVDAIVEAMKMPGVYLLDREMDSDHNRCVITLVGERDAIQEAAIRGVGKASELIDLNKHAGRPSAHGSRRRGPVHSHRRRHALKIASPWPITWASRSGIAFRFLYISTNPRLDPRTARIWRISAADSSKAFVPKSRPILRGARILANRACIPRLVRRWWARAKFLIAYNVFLNTPDVEIAKKIAKAVRFSSGGMRFVKGAGFLVRGLAQVSMNLTDFEQTPIHRVFELVKREAARYGVMPISSEIVGLIPKKALEQAAEWFLQVENFDSSLILENRLAAVMGGKMAVGGLRAGVEPFVEQLAAPTATPGGGSASAAAGAMAAGLALMVASMSRGKKAYLQHETQLSAAIASLTPLREELKAAVDADAESYNSVMKAYKAAKTDEKSGERLIEAALKEATAVPLGVAEKAYEVAQLVKLLEPITNPNMKSDLVTASALAGAAIAGALANVQINLASLKDEAFAAEVHQRTARLRS